MYEMCENEMCVYEMCGMCCSFGNNVGMWECGCAERDGGVLVCCSLLLLLLLLSVCNICVFGEGEISQAIIMTL
jgi:hypothetical protein